MTLVGDFLLVAFQKKNSCLRIEICTYYGVVVDRTHDWAVQFCYKLAVVEYTLGRLLPAFLLWALSLSASDWAQIWRHPKFLTFVKEAKKC